MRSYTLLAMVLLGMVGAGCKRGRAQETHEDPRTEPLTAALEAPEGKTPCETAHNSFIALDTAALKAGQETPWDTLPKREQFLDLCQRLPLEMQNCSMPRYMVANRPKCERVLAEMEVDPWGKQVFQLLRRAPPNKAP